MSLKSFLGFCFAKYIVYKNKKWKNNAVKYQEKNLFSLIKQAKNTRFGVDHSLRVWDLTKNTCRELTGHFGEITFVIKLNETKIVSGSQDTTLPVWDLTNDTSRVLRGHTDTVLSVMKLNETTIVSGSIDSTLRVWDLNKLPR